jgi:hypothetical protein
MRKSNVRAVQEPKEGATQAQCEDEYRYRLVKESERTGDVGVPRSLRVIIADGASESMLARRWARHLVKAFCAASENVTRGDGFTAAYKEACGTWGEEVARYRREREDRGSPVQWYQEAAMAKGAHATVLAAEFSWTDHGNGQWTAAAFGDACLFHVSGGQLPRAFPAKHSSEFGDQPPLLCSDGSSTERLATLLAEDASPYAQEDVCYLATDALAAWFLRSHEAGNEAWGEARKKLDTATEPGKLAFRNFVRTARGEGHLKNDDTTLVRVDLS